MFAKIPYIWDYDIDEDKLKNILSGKLLIGHIDKKRAVIRLLEYAPYHEIIRLIGYRGIIARTHKELELTNQAAVDEFFRSEQPEYVFMAAGLTGGIVANKTYPATFLHANISMQDNVFEAAHKHNVKHLIFTVHHAFIQKTAHNQ